jgi:hypothetical protein
MTQQLTQLRYRDVAIAVDVVDIEGDTQLRV